MLYQILSNPVWQTVAAFVAIITPAITIIGLIHRSQPKKKNLWYFLTVFLTVLLIAGTSGVIYILAPHSTTASDPSYPTTSSTSAISNSSTPTTTQASSLIMVPLNIQQPSEPNLSAVLYFGQLGVLLQNHPDVGFSTDSDYAQQHGQLCVETVVVSSISGKTAVVNSQRLPTSWGAAEAIPQSDMTQTNYIAQQQLIVPPASIGLGTSYVGQAQVVIDQNITAVTETYRLTLKTITSPQTQWNVQKSNGTDFGNVECNAWPN